MIEYSCMALGLTERQAEVHHLVAMGASTYKDIAAGMRISSPAVHEMRCRAEDKDPNLEIEFYRKKLHTGRYIDLKGFQLTERQAEMHEYVVLGVTSKKDIACALGCSLPNVDEVIFDSEKHNPQLEVTFHDSRIEAAIDMRKGGAKWQEIADALRFSSFVTAFKAVKGYVGGNIRNMWKE